MNPVQLKQLLETMPEKYIDTTNSCGHTATMWAASKHCLPILKELMPKITAEHINLVDKNGRNLLFHMLNNPIYFRGECTVDKEIVLELLSKISVKERMIQDENGMTLLMVAAKQKWDEDVIEAILADTPVQYKNIQSKSLQQTAVMYYLNSCKRGQVCFSLFKMLMEGVDKTNMVLKDKNGNTVTFHALDYCQGMDSAECRARQLYGCGTYAPYSPQTEPETPEERRLVLCYLFERMTVEQRMSDVKEEARVTRAFQSCSTITRTTTYLMMLLGRVPVKVAKFSNVFGLLLKDTTPEWRMKGNGETTPAILACTFDCLMNEEIFDWLVKDMPQEYLEKEMTQGFKDFGGPLLQTLLKSCKYDASKEAVIRKVIPFLSSNHLYGTDYKFGSYLISFVRYLPGYGLLVDFVKDCPTKMHELWLTATDYFFPHGNVLHAWAGLEIVSAGDVLMEVLQTVPKSTFYAKNGTNNTPLDTFLSYRHSNDRGMPNADSLKVFSRLHVEEYTGEFVKKYSEYLKALISVLVKFQTCFSLWLLDKTIYGDVNGNTNTITLSDEDVLDILPWSGTTSPSITNEMTRYFDLQIIR
eukprot:TRINITY_DN2053_c0_g2_i3.p1 TRINITY_DN2053_c0_g2~~TRINITY_DN2053_c0_g2_i3.p1  ORF type:complete len:585 (+),score=67.60 TRINITY_DN2053_c0_g2_i3:748-2502(+)